MIQPSIKVPVSLLPQHIQRIHSARARPRRQRRTPIASLLPAAAATAAAASLQLSRRAIMAGATAAKGASTATCNAGSESEKSCQLYVPSAHELGFDQEAFRQGKLSIVILGATGDLAKKEIFPALLDLVAQRFLPEQVVLVGVGRSKRTSEEFRQQLPEPQELKPALLEACPSQANACEGDVNAFLQKMSYCSLDYKSQEDFKGLQQFLEEVEDAAFQSARKTDSLEQPALRNRVFYFAVPPFVFEDAASAIKETCLTDSGFNRIILEKPFGRDLHTAEELSTALKRLYTEDQLYRMDHFLGYEVCQNILSVRFRNAFVEPLMNNRHVAAVRISLKEDFGTQGRGGYFTKYGNIRDVVQNHLLQVLTLVALERPDGDLRAAKLELLRAVRDISMDEVVVGQYVAGNDHPGFLEDDSIAERDEEAAKRCPTFVQLVIRIDNDRWRGVPFIILAGKGLEESRCEVRIQFKETRSPDIFPGETCPRNELVMRVSPHEAIYMRMNMKTPGLSGDLTQSELDLCYNSQYGCTYRPRAYARLLLEALRGHQDQFVGEDELLRAWEIFTPLLEKLEGHECDKKLVKYPFGSQGPQQARDMLPSLNFLEPEGPEGNACWKN